MSTVRPGRLSLLVRPARRSQRVAYVFLLPMLLAMAVVQIIPMLAGLVMSFGQLNQYTITDWTHAPTTLSNFTTAFATSAIGGELLSSFLITLAYVAIVVGFSWAFGIAAAVFLSEARLSNKIFRAVFLLPYAIPAFAGIMVWATCFQPGGAVNTLLGNDLHLIDPGTLWLGAGDRAFFAMSVTALWRSWPFAFLMLFAAVQSIPAELYEAAEVDGASQWQVFRLVTLPSVQAVSALVALILGFWTFNDFATPYLMFGVSVPDAAKIISSEIYMTSFTNLDFGLGAAMSVGVIAFLAVTAIIYVRLMRKDLDRVFNV